jgi:hypothetical protein
MQQRSRSIIWRGQAFHFQCLRPEPSSGDTPVWAVSRSGEFIGTMACAAGVTTKDFDARGLRWLGELLGDSTATTKRPR